jgi:hypothetical protein
MFAGIGGLVSDSVGNIYVADTGNNMIRKISTNGNVSTIAGDRKGDFRDGSKGNARFNQPKGIDIDENNNLYVTDMGNNVIRKIDVNGKVTTIAGDRNAGNKSGEVLKSQFKDPIGISIYNGSIFVVDQANHQIRKIN